MEDWKIHKDRSSCHKPECPLAHEREYYALLQLPECLRLERCESCFDELRHGGQEMPFHWKVRRTNDGKKQPSLDLESLRALFDRLGEITTGQERTSGDALAVAEVSATAGGEAESADCGKVDTASGLRYLVALLLLRKRRLKMVDPQNAEQEAADLVVVDPKIEAMEPVALFAPDLGPDRLGNLREELMAAIGDEHESQAFDATPGP